jgi:hypothetical protein
MYLRKIPCPQYGLRPPDSAHLQKPSLPGLMYVQRFLHCIRASARAGCIGTCFCDDSVLHGPRGVTYFFSILPRHRKYSVGMLFVEAWPVLPDPSGRYETPGFTVFQGKTRPAESWFAK